MPSSMKDIKNRIKSIESTMQITKAMELVASSKLKKARERIEKSRPYFDFLKETIYGMELSIPSGTPFFAENHEIRKVCCIVIAGDRGLAGGFNGNLFKKVVADNVGTKFCVVPVGKKVSEFFERRNTELICQRFETAESVSIADCYDLGRELCSEYQKKKFDVLKIYYTKFVSMLTQTPAGEKILPLETGKGDKKKNLTLYEPDSESVFKSVVPLYVSGMIYGALAESQTSEFAARRTAMDNANKNAGEMIDDLTLKYNRARQAAITQEINEIVSGAEAL